MEKRALIAFALSMAVFIGWSMLFGTKPVPPEKAAQTQESSPATTAAPATSPDTAVPAAPGTGSQTAVPAAAETVSAVSAQDVTVTTDLYKAVFSESGGRLKNLELLKYKATTAKGSPPKDLVGVAQPDDIPLGLRFLKSEGLDLERALFQPDRTEISVTQNGQSESLVMVWKNSDGLTITRKYTFTAGSYLIGMDITVQNFSDKTIDNNLVVSLASLPLSNKDRYAGFGAVVDGKLIEEKPGDVKDEIEDLKSRMYILSWAAYEDQYFMTALLPADQEKTRFTAQPYGEKGVEIDFINPPLVMPPNTEKTYSYQIFYGPKDYELLKSMDNDLKKSIDFGWLNFLGKPLLIFMVWLYGFVGNYGIVIIIITILIKILFWPLTAKSYKSMKGMQKLQPQVMKLREKYKNDREAMNREMMQLYRTYKVNPLGGCLPMVIQIPVFIALYRLLDYALELRHAPFWLWIQDLSAPDRLFHFGFNIPFMEAPSGIPILTLLMGASMLIQQKMTPTPGDPTQAKIMMLMPVFFTFIFINFPSGLVLYWLVNNILSIGQQTLINKRPS